MNRVQATKSQDDIAISVSQLGRYIAGALNVPSLHDVWVCGELSDVRTSGGHCYMELVEKDAQTGHTLAKVGASIWANNFVRLEPWFRQCTGRAFADGLKVLVRGTINYHPAYGMKFVINMVDPSYTLGEVERRRREILDKLKAEGILDMNRNLQWPAVPLRIAIVSAPGAAGYGDFINQLYSSPYRIRFKTRLFPAIMQGERTVPSVIDALDIIAGQIDCWDCVVIIRGGGSTSDLLSFDNYDLAANIAQFPLPVIVGIGHERDITVLDYVANLRVKTPTAAAEWLIAKGASALQTLRDTSIRISRCVADKLSGCLTQLAQLDIALGVTPCAMLDRANARLSQARAALAEAGTRRLGPESGRLQGLVQTLQVAVINVVSRQQLRLDSSDSLLGVLSPQATLRRGYSITRVDGKAVTDASAIAVGTVVHTTLASGIITSTVTNR